MNQRWTLHVENFARIKSADIEIAPLMCFIGDNNSGKSYIMNLLWGIIANGREILQNLYRDYNKTEKCIRCNKWIEQNIGKTVTITDEVEQMYIDWFNELLAQCKDEILRKTFNYDIKAGKIEIRNFSRTEKLSVHIWDASKKFPERKQIHGSNIILELHLDVAPLENWSLILCWVLLMRDLVNVNSSLLGEESPIYLPASRTGLLLVHRLIASKSMKNILSINSAENFQEKLTAPYVQFLDLLINFPNTTKIEDNKKLSLLNFIKSEIIHGSIKISEDVFTGKKIRYSPEDSENELPMSITSSVVTEEASLFLLLTTRLPLRLTIIEEPEAHLHPALQKKIAQLLIRFIHNGIPVWITTHSDTILQHFNNMIKLNNRSTEREELMQEFNYSDEDLLTSEEINLYQFERGEKHTDITKLESGKYGFVAPSFNKSIDKLMSEIFAFQEDE